MTENMRLTIIKRIYHQLVLLVIFCAILIITYVSAGRLLMPMVSGYASYFEGRIIEYTGVPVSIKSLAGSFDGLNPEFRIDGLRLLIGATIEDQNASALVFDSATIIVDIPRSIWERRWILEDFAVETLEINVEESENGNWRLAGFENGDNSQLDFNDLFQSLQRISLLNLRDVGIKFSTKQGNSFSLHNGIAAILNEGESHFLHVNANLDQNTQQIALSFEVTGNELSEIDGRIHVALPEANYSRLFVGQSTSSFSISEMMGGLNIWVDIEDGQFSRGVTELFLEKLALQRQEMEPIVFNDMSGVSSLNFSKIKDEWELAFSDLSFNWKEHSLQNFSIYSRYNADNGISLSADYIDLAFLSQFALGAGFLSGDPADQVARYGLKGGLENLYLFVPFEEADDQSLRLETNIIDGEVLSVGSSPSMRGLNGYLEGSFAIESQVGTGFVEVESEAFSINLPNIFTNVWDYNYVNGRLNFRADLSDGQKVKIASGIIVAESEAVDGRAVFTLSDNRTELGERDAYLELLVGASRADASFKSLYLPDGPNVKENTKNSMEFLSRAILGGNIENSGVIFRGNSLPNSPGNEKTFQSFFVLSNGEVNFSDEWPDLQQLSGYVMTDDTNVEISVQDGTSFGLELRNMEGDIQRNEFGKSWLNIEGQVTGETSAGFDYLVNVPVGEDIKNSISNWEVQGDFLGELNLNIPLNQSDFDTDVHVNFMIEENMLIIPEFDLTFNQLTGPLVYDTKVGLEKTELEGSLFARPVTLAIFSEKDLGEIKRIFVEAEGLVGGQELRNWPKQSSFVKEILAQMEGEFSYSASLLLDQSTDLSSNFLNMSSNLQGASLNLPMPFGKSSVGSVPLNIDIEFGDQQLVSGTFGEELSFILDLGSLTNNGIIYFGDTDADLASLIESGVEGIAILGNLEKVMLEDWVNFLGELTSLGSASTGFTSKLAFVDVVAGVLELYGQELPDVNMRIEGDELSVSPMVTLLSDSVQGKVNLPLNFNESLEIDLEYLRLPSNENYSLNYNEFTQEEDKEDPLAFIDPRQLPPLMFSTDEFSIGDRSYGSWQFTLNPNSDGASFTDLVFDFRGLRLGMDGPYVDGSEIDEYAARFAPSFSWSFDGTEHASALTGIIYADDIAEVLTANGYAASIESEDAIFFTDISWPGSPAFFAGSNLSGEIDMDIDNGRFQQGSAGQGALRLISILNVDAIMRRARLSNDLVRTGFAYDEIEAELNLTEGHVQIEDRLVISGPSSLYQITGELDLKEETIIGEMYVTLPVSDNIPWLGLLTANLPLAFGAYLFDQIFGEQVDSLTSAVYSLDGPWEGLEPEFKQAFGSPEDSQIQ